jgi:hypothetical protein
MIPLILLAVFLGLAARNKPQRGPVADALCQVLASPEPMNPGFGLIEAVVPIAFPEVRWPQSDRWTTEDIAELDEIGRATLEEARVQVQKLLRSAAFLKTCATAESDYAKAVVVPVSPAGFEVAITYGPGVEVLKDGTRRKATPDKTGPIPDVGAAIRVAELAAYRIGIPPSDGATFDRGIVFDMEGGWDGLSGWTEPDGAYITRLYRLAPPQVETTQWDNRSGFETALAAAMEGE